MNTVWSDYIQGIDTLYLSRRDRFDDAFSDRYKQLFSLDARQNLRVLEVGCGPGALCEALKRWYPNADITGIDRDSAFIAFARSQVPGVSFIEADATSLPFEDESFDVTVSNTVSEHVEPSAFFGEQRRLLNPGGVCIVLSARKGINICAECVRDDEIEQAFWQKAASFDDSFEKYAVCRYPMNEAELPAAMERYGFTDVRTGYAVSDQTPDDPRFSRRFSLQMIQTQRKEQLDSLRGVGLSLSDKFTKDEFEYMETRINAKYDERVRLFESGQKQWDTRVSLVMALRGEKA